LPLALRAPPAEAEALRDKIKGARLVVIEGAGHLSNVERPEEFNLALVDFLRGSAFVKVRPLT
jgi:pimeloyl-ACP methyl ester carboxylesterase